MNAPVKLCHIKKNCVFIDKMGPVSGLVKQKIYVNLIITKTSADNGVLPVPSVFL